MLLKDLIYLLGKSPISIVKQIEDRDFLFIDKLETYNHSLQEDTLYFGDIKTAESRISEITASDPAKKASLVLFCSGSIPDDIKNNYINILCFRDAAEFNKAYELLQSNIRRSMRYNNRLQEFMELIAKEDDLSVILNWLEGFFGHPINFVDSSFTYLAHSDTEGFKKFGSAELMKDILNGYVDPDHLIKMQKSQDVQLFRTQTTEPVLIYAPGENFQQYHKPITIGGTIAGAMSIYLHMDEDLDPLLILYLNKIAKLMSIVLQRISFYQINKAGFFASLFKDLLGPSPNSKNQWEERLKAFGYELKPCLNVIATHFHENEKQRREMQSIAASLSSIFPGSLYYLTSDSVILLTFSNPGKFTRAYANSQADDYCARNDLKLGISPEFDSIYDLNYYLEKAYAAIDIGKQFYPDRKIYLYDDLRLHDMMHVVMQHSRIRSYCYPPFLKLIEYDKQHGTELAPTLYCYLMNLKDLKKACSELHIHKNTLYFRLDKIQDLMNVDITGLDAITQIHLSVIILRYFGEFPKADIF